MADPGHDVPRTLPPPVPSKLSFFGENKLTRWIKLNMSEEYYLFSLSLTAIAFRLFQKATTFLVERVDDLPRTPWDTGRNYTVTDINNMLMGYGSLGREVYSAVCISDSLFVVAREISVLMTQFSFWSYAPVQWTPELLFLLVFVVGLAIDLTENLAGYISVFQYPNTDPFWANLICKANEAKWNWIYVEIAIVSFGFIVSVFFRAPKLYRKMADFFWPNTAARRRPAEAAAVKAKAQQDGVVNGEENSKEGVNGNPSPNPAEKNASNVQPRQSTPRKRKVITK